MDNENTRDSPPAALNEADRGVLRRQWEGKRAATNIPLPPPRRLDVQPPGELVVKGGHRTG